MIGLRQAVCAALSFLSMLGWACGDGSLSTTGEPPGEPPSAPSGSDSGTGFSTLGNDASLSGSDGGGLPSDATVQPLDGGAVLVDGSANGADSGPVGADAGAPRPKRVVFIYNTHSFNGDPSLGDWKPERTSDGFRLSARLAALEPFRDQMVFIDGLNGDPVRGQDFTGRVCINYTILAGVFSGECKRSHRDLPRTIDHWLASLLNGDPTHSPVVLSHQGRPHPYHVPPLSVSFDSGGVRIEPLVSPVAVIDALTGRLPATPPMPEADELYYQLADRAAEVESANDERVVPFMAEAIATMFAYQTDHVATFLLGHRGLYLPWVVGADPAMTDQGLAHERVPTREALLRWYVGKVAHLLSVLDSLPDGSGTLLDHTLVVWFNDAGRGYHNPGDIPVMLFGGALPNLRFGEYLTFSGARLLDLWMTIGAEFGLAPGTLQYAGEPARVLPELFR